MARKKQKRKNSKTQNSNKPSPQQLKAINRLVDKGNSDLAQSRIEALLKQFPKFSPLYFQCIGLYEKSNQYPMATWTALRWTQVSPNSINAWTNLARLTLKEGHMALLHKAISMHNELAQQTGDELIDEPSLQKLQGMIMENSIENPAFDSLGDAIKFDTGKLLLDAQQWQKAISFMHDLRKYSTVANNYAVALFHVGEINKAKQAYYETYQKDPNNLFAANGYLRLLVWDGQLEEANKLADIIKEKEPKRPLYADAQLIALAFLGRFDEALECYQKIDKKQLVEMEAGFNYLAACIAFNTGDKQLTKQLWDILPSNKDYRGGETDLIKLMNAPAEQIHQPALFAHSEILPLNWIKLFRKIIKRGKNDVQIFEQLRAKLNDFPSADYLRLSRESVDDLGLYFLELMLSAHAIAGNKEKKQLLLEQFTDRRTSLETKMDTLRRLQKQGIITKEDTVDYWTGSKISQLKPLSFTITREPKDAPYSDKDRDLLTQALALLRSKEGRAEARKILMELAERYPDDRPIRGNIAASWVFEDPEKSTAEYESTLEKFPDYTFARCMVADDRIMNNKLEEAKVLLDGIMDKEEYHIDEYIVINGVKACYHAKKGEEAAARQYLNMIKQVSEYDHEIESLKSWEKTVNYILHSEKLDFKSAFSNILQGFK